MKNKLPIGYYLKKADNLLNEGIDKVHEEAGINRLQWQILHSIHEGYPKEKMVDVLREFANPRVIDETLDQMTENQLISQVDGLSMTEKGRVIFEQCLQEQKEFRLKAVQNISEDEYFTTIETLEKIINNMEGQ